MPANKTVQYIGTAGWSIPRAVSCSFDGAGTHLQRYARVLNAAEINSSFHRPHRRQLYEKWAADVPEEFRFAVKIPKTITHEQRLRGVERLLDAFGEEVAGLGKKLGCLLIQLPPSLEFDAALAGHFFARIGERFQVDLACEPRHASWFEPQANILFKKLEVARVAADPAKVPLAALPGGYTKFCYFRLHGSPRMYYSPYTTEYIECLAAQLSALRAKGAHRAWCFFDNTASGAAASNALELALTLRRP